MNRKSKSNKLAAPFFILASAILLFATNPTEKRFKEYLKTTMETKAHENGKIPGAIMELFSESASWLVDLHAKRNNYLFFSVYTVSIVGEEQKYIGVINNFIKL